MNICDVCKEEVVRKDDATHIEAIATNSLAVVFLGYPRHIRCSPSRAQHIVHEDFEPVVDDRQAYDKRLLPESKQKLWDKKWTDAWVSLQNESEDV